ncbi:MAG TPA: hypothetical protein VHR16_03640 [Candidatus Limnocylindrales bacterium]|nr:hypothetical protein [Candidatus Limnocylindrales bacterium]
MAEQDENPRRGATPGERRLAQAPSARYATTPPPASEDPEGSALPGPLARASLVAVAGAIVLTVVGAILTSTAGLLFVAGVTGAAIGLVLASARAPISDARPVSRQGVTWLSIALAIGAVALASVATWLIGRTEGGVLGLVDYLLETFGPFVPGEALLAALGAWWGANTGPVQR